MRNKVHGGIRHLEIQKSKQNLVHVVHGGIRHLETPTDNVASATKRSWRHTPFRNMTRYQVTVQISSWRHTPFRNDLS
ncbi:hypothetical protein J558_0345 [Acinetobacter baumannii 1106579]|nr:hypothetical protein J558_0345 [Acinetobacter baumannii 1106579]EXE77826.1 hypothetical protein J583_2145 [Acinetobacter baumannii 83444]